MFHIITDYSFTVISFPQKKFPQSFSLRFVKSLPDWADCHRGVLCVNALHGSNPAIYSLKYS